MSRKLIKPNFPLPPSEYDQQYLSEVVRSFSIFLQQMQNPGDGRFSTVTITALPTNDIGLESGSLYNHEGVVRVSELKTSSVAGQSLTATIGSVSVSIS